MLQFLGIRFSTTLAFATTASMSVSSVMPNKAHAWGDLGHEIVGEIAERVLDAKGKNVVRGILGIEPLAVAATWPDKVRSDNNRFAHDEPDPAKRDHDHRDFDPFHFCEIPVGYTYETAPKKFAKNCYGAIVNGMAVLKSPRKSREEKMIALRYLIHVVGDIHQPLHVGNGYDRGANACQIKWKEKPEGGFEQAMNFHSFWDGTMVKNLGDSYADFPNKVYPPRYFNEFVDRMVKRDPSAITKEAKAKVGAINVSNWLMESAALREKIYPDNPQDMGGVKKGEEYKSRPYCLWYLNQDTDKQPAPGSQINRDKIPVLGQEYASQHVSTVEQRLVAAGLRLAAILDSIGKEVASPSVTDSQEDKILKGVQDGLRNK